MCSRMKSPSLTVSLSLSLYRSLSITLSHTLCLSLPPSQSLTPPLSLAHLLSLSHYLTHSLSLSHSHAGTSTTWMRRVPRKLLLTKIRSLEEFLNRELYRLVQFSIQEQLIRTTLKRSRGWLVFKVHRRLNHSALGLRVEQKKENQGRAPLGCVGLRGSCCKRKPGPPQS